MTGPAHPHGGDPTVQPSDNPRPYILAGLLVVVVLVGGIGAWSTSARLQGAVVASGTFTVELNRKTVQHLDGGIVSEILVRDGDPVIPGQLLMRLDATVDRSNLDVIDGQLDVLEARAARLRAERHGRDLDLPAALSARADDPAVAKILNGERDLFAARRSARAGEAALLDQRVAGFAGEIAGLEAQIRSTERQTTLITEELGNLRELYDKGYAKLTRILALERQAEQLTGVRAALGAEIARAHNRIAETKLELSQRDRDFQETVRAELRLVDSEIVALQERRIAAAARLGRTEILAHHEGIVLNLAAHTVGGVIRPGQDILEIVPEGDDLVVEVAVPVGDIDKVAQGQESIIRLSAFDRASAPELVGTVESVSADQMLDPTSHQPYYLARIRPVTDGTLEAGGERLKPGMPAEVFIRTGERTALSYFVKPLTDRLARTFTEG